MEEMLEKVKEEVLSILKETVEAFEKKEYNRLKEISNHTTHTASIYQDKDSIAIAVIVYALFKIISRSTEKEMPIEVLIKKVFNHLKSSIQSLKQNNLISYRKCIAYIIADIAKADDKINLYIQETIKQAEIKKGSRLYEHGISAAQASEVLGISQWELMPYVGKTTFSELRDDPARIMRRLEIAREIFNTSKITKGKK